MYVLTTEKLKNTKKITNMNRSIHEPDISKQARYDSGIKDKTSVDQGPFKGEQGRICQSVSSDFQAEHKLFRALLLNKSILQCAEHHIKCTGKGNPFFFIRPFC